MKKLWLIPAFKRVFGNPNVKKLVSCRCWPLGRAQCFYLLIQTNAFSRIWKSPGLKHWTKSKAVKFISDPNLYKCIIDEDIRSLFVKTVTSKHLLAKAKFSVFSFLKHPHLDTFKRTGKVPFVQCKKWLISNEWFCIPWVPWYNQVDL